MNIRTFTVQPSLTTRLKPLMTIAKNIYWCWNPEAVRLFQRIDMDLWETTYHSPIKLLGELSQERLDELLHDDSFLSHMDNVSIQLEDYLSTHLWFDKKHPDEKNLNLCYFSMEFGLTESVPIYSGGLGLLAGDHLKAASDLGLPLIGIGLLYREGYFRQYLNAEGWQQETYPENDFATLPVDLVRDENDSPLKVTVDFPGRTVHIQIWRLHVGRVTLHLLDTNVEENSHNDRGITGQLYGGDTEMRVQQEIVLGIGGLRALLKLGITPNICHMNEGHSAFLALERIRYFMENKGLNFPEAAEITTASNVFTTHTPVPAGNDSFSPDLMNTYFKDYFPALGLAREQFMGLGRQNPFDKNEPFCMTVLALRLAAFSNGVSKLHGEVSRRMWKQMWPGLQEDEFPIGHITNGVHTTGWVSHEMSDLYTRYLGPRWKTFSHRQKVWDRVDNIPDSELWRTHERRRERLVAFARKRIFQQMERRGALPSDIAKAAEVLDPEALTLGFARRFATYKRGDMLLSDPDRLDKILNNPDMPVQIIFAGKAHPRDDHGKELIKKVVQMARQPRFRNRIAFVEDFDINVAHYMVQGVDVWVNNPRRPLEASGTSGMKVSANGGLNLSILDGWWVEGYNGENGWAIGNGEEYEDHAYGDSIEARALYDLLEKEVVPTFYKRGQDSLPRGWIGMMKNNLKSICPVFSTNRMVIDYLEKFYLPGAKMRIDMMANDFAHARKLAEWKLSIRKRWSHLAIESVKTEDLAHLKTSDALPIRVFAQLGEIDPSELRVEVYYGRLNSMGQIRQGKPYPLEVAESLGDGRYLFAGEVTLERAGRCGFGIRILPYHEMMIQRFEPGLILWG